MSAVDEDLAAADRALQEFKEAQGEKAWLPEDWRKDLELRRRVADLIELVRHTYACASERHAVAALRDLRALDKQLGEVADKIANEDVVHRVAVAVAHDHDHDDRVEVWERRVALLAAVAAYRRDLAAAMDVSPPWIGGRDEALRAAVAVIRERAAGLVGRGGPLKALSVNKPDGPGCAFVVAVLNAAGVDASHSTISKF